MTNEICHCPCCKQGIAAPHEYHLERRPMPPREDDPVVGHKTIYDGPVLGFRHEALHKSEADALIAAADAAMAKRAADMPTEEDAARAMWSAWQRLKELGWRETCYGPTGQTVRLIEPGSSGIHQGSRHEPWPSKTWWVEDCGDLWPSNPCLFKPLGSEGNAGVAPCGKDQTNGA